MAGRDLRSAAKEGRNMVGRGLDEEDEGWVATPGQSESESENNDSDGDPTFEAIEHTRSKLSTMSLRKSRPRASEEMETPQLDDKEKKCFEKIEKMVKDGKLDNLRIGDFKIYLRKYGLRLTGNKAVLQARIKEHLEVMEGRGEKKYPISSFALNCKGDACMGDVVIFEQNIYDMFSIVSRSATAPPCGTRIVAGRIVKESYGAAKQQHTFTIEVLWSKGEKPLPPLHPLLIKGRNLYRLKTMRQRWDDEEERERVLQEKHRRGCLARCSRETRIQEKEMKKVARGKRHQALTSEKPIAAGAQKTRHQARVSEKPTAARGHGNDVHHQEPEKCSYGAQCKQNNVSAQVLQPQPSAIVLPPVERRIYQHQNAPIRHGKTIYQRPDVNICNTLDHYIHHQNAYIRSEKPIGGTSQSSFHDLEPETHDYGKQVKPQACSYPSAFGSPQHGYQFHASHRHEYPDRKPLRNLNASSILGYPPHGNYVHSNRQNGFFGARSWRNLSSPSRVASQMPRYHPVQLQPCHLYLQGRCWYEDNCRYLH